jgi:hypothetical protein
MKHLWILVVSITLLAAACAPLAAPQPSEPTPTATPTPPDDSLTVAAAVQQAAAAQLNLSAEQIKVISVEAVEWPDGCLGVQRPEVMCIQVITPGFRVIVEADGQPYEYHTNQSGSAVVLASGAEPETAAIESQVRELLARALNLSAKQINLIRAEPTLWPDACLGVARPEMACALVETPGLLVVLEANGQPYEFHTNLDGSVILSAEFRLIWHRAGGIAGFCDTLTVAYDGRLTARNCRSEAVAEGTLETALSQAELDQFNNWVAEFGTVEIAAKDPAVADALSITLIAFGSGGEPPSQADQQALMQLAQTLHERAQK